MIMKWGIEKAKEMGVEIWLDATVYGVPLYKKHGFAVVNENNLVPEPIDEPDEEWTKIATSLGPMTMWQMVRKVDEQQIAGVPYRVKKPISGSRQIMKIFPCMQ